MAETVVGKKTYILVWAALMVLTALTGAVSFIDLHQWSSPVAMAIASLKAILVALFFMHLRYEKQKVIWVWAIAGVFWLSILFVLSMADYLTRGFLNVPGR
ncbi:MAG: cytochrome C oxidase subunit IV family protein [Terriglobales bacterium]